MKVCKEHSDPTLFTFQICDGLKLPETIARNYWGGKLQSEIKNRTCSKHWTGQAASVTRKAGLTFMLTLHEYRKTVKIVIIGIANKNMRHIKCVLIQNKYMFYTYSPTHWEVVFQVKLRRDIDVQPASCTQTNPAKMLQRILEEMKNAFLLSWSLTHLIFLSENGSNVALGDNF